MSKTHEETGEIIHVGDVEKRGAKEFLVQVFVVKTEDEKYPQEIPFELTGNSAGLKSNIGDRVTVHFSIRGREWQGRWYTSNNAFRVDVLSDGADTAQPSYPAKPSDPPMPEADDDEDLPF